MTSKQILIYHDDIAVRSSIQWLLQSYSITTKVIKPAQIAASHSQCILILPIELIHKYIVKSVLHHNIENKAIYIIITENKVSINGIPKNRLYNVPMKDVAHTLPKLVLTLLEQMGD